MSATEQDIAKISLQKWDWMISRKLDLLADLFHDQAIVIHNQGKRLSKKDELEAMKTEKILFRTADIQESSATIIGSVAMVIGKGQFGTIIRGNEAFNDFHFTEVYVQHGSDWKLTLLQFARQ